MKKIIFTITNIIIIINLLTLNCLATEKKQKPFNVDAHNAIAIDSKTRRILYEKKGTKIVPMASTTKIITSLVAIKYGNLDEKFEISKNAVSVRGSKVGYKKGEEITLRELLVGLMFKSGNDAAIAIAEGISGTVEEYCKVMNEYAIEIGIMDSNFESPHGLDSNRHYSTAYDLAIATAKAKEEKFFSDIVGKKEITKEEFNFTRSYNNINKILWQIPGANGVKTGYTGGAGKCLVTSVNNGPNDVIIVVLNCTDRWNQTSKIFNFVKDNYEYKNIKELKNQDEKIDVSLLKEDIFVPFKKESCSSFKLEINDEISKKGMLGEVKVFENDDMIYKYNIYE